MLTCLIDYIGVNGCGQAVPPSGIYINELPGVELKMIDKIADPEQVNFLGVWADVQKRAARRFGNDMNAEFNKRYKLRTITQSVNVGKKINTSNITNEAPEYRGFILELERDQQNYVASNLQVMYVQYVDLYLPGAINTTIKIFDLDTQEQLYTSALTGAQGWNRISVLQTFASRRIYICYDATLVNSVELNTQLLEQAVLYNGVDSYYYAQYIFPNLNAELRGTSSTIADKFTLVNGNNTFGLCAVFSVNCSYESFICNNLRVFENAWWYLLGIELMNERIFTSRLNEFTVGNTQRATDLKVLFTERYKGTETDKGELMLSIEGINLDQSDKCLQCNAPYIYHDAQL